MHVKQQGQESPLSPHCTAERLTVQCTSIMCLQDQAGIVCHINLQAVAGRAARGAVQPDQCGQQRSGQAQDGGGISNYVGTCSCHESHVISSHSRTIVTTSQPLHAAHPGCSSDHTTIAGCTHVHGHLLSMTQGEARADRSSTKSTAVID